MDTALHTPELSVDALPYDETIPYDEQVPAPDTGRSLAERLGATKVYLLSETSASRTGGVSYRENAILFQGTPITHLPTSNIFAYATHFDAHPMALEWIDDKTCVLVFQTNSSARLAYRHLAKSIAEEPSSGDSTVTAKPIPITLWPPEDRINKSLGKGEGLKGAIRMRWATNQDVKKKGAQKESQFYKKYGRKAGKDDVGDGGEGDTQSDRPQKRRRHGEMDETVAKAELDEELDSFLAEDETPTAPPSPPSRMRSDYIANDGRTLLERTSLIRAHPDTSLASRITAELPARARSRRGGNRRDEGDSRRVRDRRPSGDALRSGGPAEGTKRPRKTQQDLDDELDAFLNSRD
ncbi:hypothetical protein B0H21DRAFT_687388 [Amylocystis lapponica]|nr:hypothetical protein B0H21DRAFT_687388 [Amylocystis lapponica]